MTTDLTKHDEDDDLDIGFDISSIMMIVMMLLVASIMSSVATSSAQTAQVMQAMQYEGRIYKDTLYADSRLKWVDFVYNRPFMPLTWLDISNNGPGPVRVSINTPEVTFEVLAGGHAGFDRTGAKEKISSLFYQCDMGSTAVLEVEGEA